MIESAEIFIFPSICFSQSLNRAITYSLNFPPTGRRPIAWFARLGGPTPDCESLLRWSANVPDAAPQASPSPARRCAHPDYLLVRRPAESPVDWPVPSPGLLVVARRRIARQRGVGRHFPNSL